MKACACDRYWAVFPKWLPGSGPPPLLTLGLFTRQLTTPDRSYGKFTGWFVMSNVIQIIIFREVSCLLYWALKTALSGPGRGDRVRWSNLMFRIPPGLLSNCQHGEKLSPGDARLSLLQDVSRQGRWPVSSPLGSPVESLCMITSPTQAM